MGGGFGREAAYEEANENIFQKPEPPGKWFVNATFHTQEVKVYRI
jgi:hypothetical protein